MNSQDACIEVRWLSCAASDDAPGAVAGAAGELPWTGSAELGQHQIDSFGRDLEQLGRERPRHQRPRQKELDQLRQLRVAAALLGDPAHQLTGEDEPVEILVGEAQRLLEHLAEAVQLLCRPFPALRPELRLLEPGRQRQQVMGQASCSED